MKYLIVAHPDDELLWFNPEDYDKIITVFTNRLDIPNFGDKRRQVLIEHPLKEKMINWDLTESGYWRDKTKSKEYEQNANDIMTRLIMLNLTDKDSVDTHNANGEYGHADHILLHNCCFKVLNCKVNGKDPVLYRKIKKVYEKNDCWTWQ